MGEINKLGLASFDLNTLFSSMSVGQHNLTSKSKE